MTSNDALPETMRAYRVHEYSENLTKALQLDEVPVPVPGPGELLVRVEALPLNLNDIERVNGRNMMVRPELPCTPGMEVMGRVAACGDGVDGWQDRRVVAMPKQATGGFADYAICPVVSAFDMPDSVPLPDAAALYFPFHLAWLGLIDRAALKAGETVLIHAAAGGAGSAAIQIAKDVGATVIATVGSEEKMQLCRDLGADTVINYSEQDFQEIVMEATGNRGVEVVFDNVGAAVMDASMKCTAYNGRYLMMGFASDKSHADEKFVVPRSVSAGNLRLCGVLLAYADENIGPMMKKAMGWNFVPDKLGESVMSEIVDRVVSGKIKAVIGKTVSFEQLPQALEDMRARKTVGRTIVTL